MDEEEETGPNSQELLEELRITFINEQFAPEILPYKAALVDKIQELVEAQEERISELSERDFLQRSVYEMERERVQYLLRAYLRNRLQKISKFAIFIGAHPEMQSRLSESELQFFEGYLQLFKDHIDASIWSLADSTAFPEKLMDLNSMPSVAIQPKLNTHVFARVLRDCEPFTLPDRSDEEVELKRGELVLLPYAPLAPLMADGSVCLT